MKTKSESEKVKVTAKKGKMKLKFFRDGLHLNDEGYKEWAKHIKKYLIE